MRKPFGALHAIAIALLVLTGWYGLTQYSAMPDPIPVHWDLSGEADGWAPKTYWSVFGSLVIGLVMALGMLIINRVLTRAEALIGDNEREMYDVLLGYVNISIAATFAWLSIAGWTGSPLGPGFIVAVLLGGVPVFIIIGVYYQRVSNERKLFAAAGDPAGDKQYWRGGMFYHNTHDPRLFVPRPPHLGFGSTLNTGHPSARAVIIGFIAFFALMIGVLIAL